MYIAHKRDDGRIQLLCDHLKGTAERAAEYARLFGAEQMAYRAGLLHDIGKYSVDGQRRMRDPEHVKKVDHATAGAKTALEQFRDVPAAAAIVGHHGGLRNVGTNADNKDEPTVCGRCKKLLKDGLDYSAWTSEISAEKGRIMPTWIGNKYQVQFYIRMLFSCLVDADYLDTEEFMQDKPPARGDGDLMQTLYERLSRYVQPWLNDAQTALNKKRNEILKRCLRGAKDRRGLYTLTVPTGGGKTISSLGFALSHAVRYGLKRVIYVIPYTSIIEQNAEVFSRILGEENVLEHHSNVDFKEDENDDENELQRRRRAASENWDAPLVVTTAVQFFESLYAAKPSRCRKLHNLTDSVIIFDEAQMMPLKYLRPCVAAIAELVQHYGVTAVLCTATQPALDKMIREFAPRMEIREICPRKDEMLEFFRRTHIEWEPQMSDERIAERVSDIRQCLCIVNTRKGAQRIYEMLPWESRFHLSTLMTPEHRSCVLMEIRRRLRENEACHVVATSLIEAGVDVDFPQVWREEAGLDSILQAAGRCNREGKRPKEECSVHVFSTEESMLPRIEMNTKAMRSTRERENQVDSYAAIRTYFEQLYNWHGKERMDDKNILQMCENYEFRTVAEAFQMIDTETKTIYIPTEQNQELIDKLRDGVLSKGLLRKLGRSGVNVYAKQLYDLLGAGKVEECNGFYVLTDMSAYSNECGLSAETDAGAALWV